MQLPMMMAGLEQWVARMMIIMTTTNVEMRIRTEARSKANELVVYLDAPNYGIIMDSFIHEVLYM